MVDELAAMASLIDSLTVRTGSSTWVDAASQPATLDRIGRLIADALRPREPEAIGCWLAEDDTVLAHSVAVHLGLPVLRVNDDLGRMSLVPDRGLRVSSAVVVSPLWTRQKSSVALIAFFVNRGIAVRAAVSLVGTVEPQHATDGVERIVLGKSQRPDRNAAGEAW
ncbi:hypothetical protein ABT297_28425 [Dactylosporangium sp. NPDC000555]|uniref:hypothetical protein n=1 Tax=Dactylosporangium sp. NPDC000555 TaxID=3154260 RepID=UPI003330D388